MRFALACYGTRGDVEPSVSVGRELRRRGHDVSLAVPPDLVEFVQAAGLETVSYGPELADFLQEDFLRDFLDSVATQSDRLPARTLGTHRSPLAGDECHADATGDESAICCPPG